MKKKLSPFTTVSTVLLAILTIIFVFPFYWIMTGAFKDQAAAIAIPPQWFPKAPTMANFTQLLVQNPAGRCLFNSVFISLATMAAAILPLIGWPFGVFLMKQFSENIPTELLESARIDGCNELRTFSSIGIAFLAAVPIVTVFIAFQKYFAQGITMGAVKG